MTKRYLSFSIAYAVLIGLVSLAHAQDVPVLAANYDLEFSIDGQVHSVQDRARVRSGNEIPILLQNYKVGLRISESDSDNFAVQLIVYEKMDSGWYQITVPPLQFSGDLGIPSEYSWEHGGLELDIAIIVGTSGR